MHICDMKTCVLIIFDKYTLSLAGWDSLRNVNCSYSVDNIAGGGGGVFFSRPSYRKIRDDRKFFSKTYAQRGWNPIRYRLLVLYLCKVNVFL